MQLRGAKLSLHTNFLSEGKCSIRVQTPRALALYMSNIATHQLQAAVNFLNAVSEARVKKSVERAVLTQQRVCLHRWVRILPS